MLVEAVRLSADEGVSFLVAIIHSTVAYQLLHYTFGIMLSWHKHMNRDELAASLWEAVAANDEQAVTSLLEKGADPDHEIYSTVKWLISVENNEPHPLLLACKNSNLVMIKLLIEKGGIDVNRKLLPKTGETVLLASCGRYGNLDIVKYLVEDAECDRGKLHKSVYFVCHAFMSAQVTTKCKG